MTHIKKQFLSLLMSVAMVCSMSTVASAAEIGEAPVSNESEIVLQDDSTFNDMSIGNNFSVNSTYSMQALTDVEQHTNISSGQVISGSFYRSISSKSNVTIVIRSDASCTVTIKGAFGASESRYIPSGSGTYTICSAWGNPSYEIRFHSAANAAVFQFFTTDAAY